MRKFLWSSRRRKTATVSTLAVLLAAGAAVAALIIYTGATGSGSAHVQSTSTVGAISITGTQDVELVAGATTPAPFSFHNNDPDAAHQIVSLSGTVTTNPVGCASSISFNAAAANGLTIAAGATTEGSLSWTVAPSIPASCGGATASVSLSGTTSP